MGFSLNIRGIREMQGKIREVAREYPTRVTNALYEEAKIEMTESKRRVPIDTGALRESAYVDAPAVRGNTHFVEMGYTEPYAVFVHEDLEASHRIGQAKYLESVLNESRPHMAARLAARLHLDKK